MKKDAKGGSEANNKEENIVLYRKYRPRTWADVVGQEHVVRAIQGSIESGKVAHAYLLCGSRGTGKTTIARIIAESLGSSVNDIYELDAASNRGIDDVRNIKENVGTLPFDSKYKVYILDEVHMFTKDAWNALLKTIEEPPSHVIFILATTELNKVPETIVSRCQTFTFKKPNDAVLSRVISNTAEKEGYKIDRDASELIAILADGAFRDAHGILQKVIAFSKDKNITRKQVEEVTGAPQSLLVEDFLLALAQKDIELGYNTIQKVINQNLDVLVYVKMLLSTLRNALMLRYVPLMKKELEESISEHELSFILKLIENKPEHISSSTLQTLLQVYQDTKNSVINTLPIEIALVRILNNEK